MTSNLLHGRFRCLYKSYLYKYYHVLLKPVCLYISRHIRGSSVTASEYTNSTTLITSLTMSVSGKKLINSPSAVVDEALEGLTMINPGLRLLEGHRVVVREKVSGNNKHTNITQTYVVQMYPDRGGEG